METGFIPRGILLPVDDLDSSLSFYRDLLGWRLRFRDGDRYAALEAGQINVSLGVASEQPVADRPALLVKVDNVEQALVALSLDPPTYRVNLLRVVAGVGERVGARVGA